MPAPPRNLHLALGTLAQEPGDHRGQGFRVQLKSWIASGHRVRLVCGMRRHQQRTVLEHDPTGA
jgi:hypothetical protein